MLNDINGVLVTVKLLYYQSYLLEDCLLKRKFQYKSTLRLMILYERFFFNIANTKNIYFFFQAFLSFIEHCDDVSLMTAVKMMTFGISKGFESSELTEKVCKRLISNMDKLNSKDILGLTNFCSKSTFDTLQLTLLLKGELSRLFEEATSVEDIVDVLNSLNLKASFYPRVLR